MDASKSTSDPVAAVREALVSQRQRLLGLIRRRAGTRVDPLEIFQVASERALARSHQLREPTRAPAWVARIVRNVLLDELRRRTDLMVATDGDDLDIAAIDDAGIDCWCATVQADRLKPEYAMILARVVVDGRAIVDVAAELGISPNNAMVRLHRARRALAQRLREHCGTSAADSCADCGCVERGCCPKPDGSAR